MELNIRSELSTDKEMISQVVKMAFEEMEYSDQSEHYLVDKLRLSDSFIKELSLVAEFEGRIIGHILLTQLHLKNDDQSIIGLALAPVSVMPEHQKNGVGSQLINKAHELAEKLNYPFIVLIGHPEYYRKFGYNNLDDKKIQMPFDVPNEYCFILKLKNAKDQELEGELIYDSCFFEA